MRILAFESSCDETGAAVVECELGPGSLPPRLRAHTLHSQIALHQPYGGVVPELASRDHVRRIAPLASQALKQAGLSIGELDAVAYTAGPGLAGALLVGAAMAHSVAFSAALPVLPVHHLEGHLLSPFIDAAPGEAAFPFVALLVSGGHTQLMSVQGVGCYELLGESIDDAAGEAFDKSAMLLGLPYPGGAALSRLAEGGRADAFAFPRPLAHDGSLDFSFSGLKTSFWTRVQRLSTTEGEGLDAALRADLAASVEAAIVDVLVSKSLQALRRTAHPRLVVAGGVGANRRLRERLLQASQERGFELRFPDLRFCMDNAAMIGFAAALRAQAGLAALRPAGDFAVHPRWDLSDAGLGGPRVRVGPAAAPSR